MPCDGSPSALRAVVYAAQLAKDHAATQVELLHVLDPTALRFPAASLSPEELTRLYPDAAADVLRPARQILDAEGIAYQVSCRVGDPARQIADEVHQSQPDAVVMGTRGMGPIANLMIGSVATRVVQSVDVPVTLIK